MSFSYNTVDNGTKHVKYNLPVEKIKSSDDCKTFSETQNISLEWADADTKEENSVAFSFYKNGSTSNLGHIHIKLVPRTMFPDANNDSIQMIYMHNSTFVTPLHMSYHCTREQEFNLTEIVSTSDIIGTVRFSRHFKTIS